MAKTLQNVIDYANGIKPNAFPAEVLTEWINECEGSVQTEILCIALGDVVTYEYEKNKDTELIVKPPHDRIYGLYLSAMIDFAHGEYSKYENTMQVYNSAMSEFAKWFIRTHTKSKVVVSGYYMNAYDLAVRHGFEGTEEDWLASLVGPQGIQGPQGERGLTGLPGKIQTVTSGENGSILVDGESVKVYDSTNDVHISNIAGLAGNNTGDIRELQQGVKNLENKIDYTRAYVDEVGEGKVDKVTGKGLSTNDFTDEDKTKLGSLKNYDDSVLQQAIENINGEKEDKANKVTSISESSTDEQYPSALAVKNYVDSSGSGADIESVERLHFYGDKDIAPSDESYFTVNETGETITGLSDTGKNAIENGETDVVIPYVIAGLEITNIGKYAFGLNELIRSVIVPNSIKYIDSNSFTNCVNLSNVRLSENLEFIGVWAFSGCSKLTSITIPSSVTSIGKNTFYNCKGLTSIAIPNSVTSIGVDAFSGCSSLTSITIPNSVTSIGDNAFKNCISLTIYCEQGSCAETYAKENNIPVVYTDIMVTSINPSVKTAIDEIATVNTIYDLGVQTELVITLPSGQVGDFIQVDFISGSTATDLSVNPPTTLTVNSSSGLVGFDLSPGTNTIYTLYFDWGVTGYDGTEVTYGWRFNYSEYSVDVV